MAKPYGKFSNRYRKAGAPALPLKNLRIKIKGPYDLEDLSQLFQRIIARLEDQGVHSVEDCALYLATFTRGGDRMVLQDGQGKPLEALEMSPPVSARFRATAGW